MARPTYRKPDWPAGHKTKQCPRCNGSGISRAAADGHANQRTAGTAPIESLKCGYCYGRGRVLETP